LPIDLIIMDMAMPVMSGLDAAKEIRRRESLGGPSVAHMPKRYSFSTSPSNTSNLRSFTSDPSKFQLEPAPNQDLSRFSFPSSPSIPSSTSMGMLGYAAITKKKNRRIPIIGLSGHLKDSYAERAIECGMDEYITKPFRKNDLLAAIERVCGMQDDDELIEE
jgi:CheY-like chemotaxis protein